MIKSALYAAIGFAALSSVTTGSSGDREDLFFGDGPVASRNIHDVSAP
jgi:hypothetical protein